MSLVVISIIPWSHTESDMQKMVQEKIDGVLEQIARKDKGWTIYSSQTSVTTKHTHDEIFCTTIVLEKDDRSGHSLA